MQEAQVVRGLLVNLVFQVILETQDHQDLSDILGILDQQVLVDNQEAWDFRDLRETLDGLAFKVKLLTNNPRPHFSNILLHMQLLFL